MHIWEAWIGQKIVRCESQDDQTVIVLEDGRGIKFRGIEFSFVAKDVNGPLWQETSTEKLNRELRESVAMDENLYVIRDDGRRVRVTVPEKE